MDAAEAFELALAMARTAHESRFDEIFAAHRYALWPAHQMCHPFTMLAQLAPECPGGSSAPVLHSAVGPTGGCG
jgi:hypothetical protein